MSEIHKHYGVDDEGAEKDERPKGASRRDDGLADRAGDALGDARDAAARAADRASRTADRLRHSVSDGYDRAEEWAHESYDSLSRNAVYARRRTAAEFSRGRRSAAAFVEENPIMVGVAGLAAGLLIGALLPATRRENRLFGSYADDLRREGVRYARDVAEQGREAISENLRSVARSRDEDERA